MKKLILATAIAAAAAQAQALDTTLFEGTTNIGTNACIYGVLPCTAGGTIGAEFNWNDDGDGVLQTAEFVSFRLMVDGAEFALVPAAELPNINILALDVNAGTMDFWWTGAISPHVTVSAPGNNIELCQGSAAYLGDASCGVLSGTLTIGGTTMSGYGASPVPVPAAAWLFGSALLGLAGVGRKRRA
jgi:hypothetical protein